MSAVTGLKAVAAFTDGIDQLPVSLVVASIPVDVHFIEPPTLKHQLSFDQLSFPGFADQFKALQPFDRLFEVAFALDVTIDLAFQNLNLLLGTGGESWNALKAAVFETATRQQALG